MLASAELTAVGGQISKIGLAGNMILDVYEGNWEMLAFRGIKYAITAGTGKAIDRVASGMLDNIILKSKFFIYDKLVSSRIQRNYIPTMPPQP